MSHTPAEATTEPETPPSSAAPIPVPGLEGVVAANTRLSRVDGARGELLIAGFQVEQLAPRWTFPETAYLLWHGSLPTTEQRQAFERALALERELSATTLSLIESAVRESRETGVDAAAALHPMDLLRAGTSTLRPVSSDLEEREQADARTATRIVASLPTIIATGWRLANGLDRVAPRPDLSHSANYLYMISGREPSPEATRALDTYCNTVVDHGMNASTFTARVIISTHSDLISAVVGAIGALKGPLHGGAPGPALDMVFEIGEPERAESYLRAKIERGERLMGFGHRVYKVRDPRAEVLSTAVERLMEESRARGSDGSRKLLALNELTQQVETTAIRLLEEAKPGRKLQTNVEFYTALLLHSVGLPKELFTPTFAMARAAGWCAHAFEQLTSGRLIRPRAVYTGPVYQSLPKR